MPKTKSTSYLGLEIAPKPKVSMDDLKIMAADAKEIMEKIRSAVFMPNPRKVAPEFSPKQLMDICGVTRNEIKSAETSLKKTWGTIKEGEFQKTYSLEDLIDFGIASGSFQKRPDDKLGKVITIANYKGGVGKTTTAVTLAQGLTMRGSLKVLIIDLDAQASATSLLALNPELDVEEDDTIMKLVYEEITDLSDVVQKTYWHNLDLIPASSALLASDYIFPARLNADRNFEFWAVLEKGLETIRQNYDCVILDGAPNLGYLTQNAMYSADILVTPCPQEALDFASLAQFWGVYMELSNFFPKIGETKTFDCVEVLVSKGSPGNDETANIIKAWMKAAYKDRLCDISIPKSNVPAKAAAMMGTVYEIEKSDISPTSFRRYKEPMDAFVDHMINELHQAWRR
jgi:chromosome partitioning protein